jgi:DHA1 family multidrug resistance protein-like MFS transporter
MFASLGVNWSGTMLGIIAVLLVPIPIIFYKYGHKIREKSKFAPTAPPKAAESEDDASNGVTAGEMGEKAV